ncbi:Xaa-Pro dipeptidyl-peptidase [Gandjariella thermophila]|uniref:X-Pro dipeptidyl-peptidase n=1 Tax=Gandjariella thermophila TaxID=1931992 RepID=A0A4D4J3V9_9PSEU|nr:Xaa-Pro dipeptidyl-peptidase [Gandjariella thermophila]GDY31365.1 X-Pro dipeptidyl-peptidase [Gandjariella thermophila]
MGTLARRPLLALLVLAALVTPVTPVAAQAGPPPFEVRDGVTQPIFDFAAAIRETTWVDTGMDGDADGRPDRVAVDVVRPAEPARRGQRVPVIMDASPYYSCCGRGNENQVKTYDAAGRPVGFPLFYDNYFVPRGYAVALVDLAGTNRSQGCVDVGGPSDVASARAVVDWLSGRRPGYDAPTGGRTSSATWSTGAVGMIGKSYDGSIANGVAATGVAGLRTIVPISAIGSWYDYFNGDGVSFGADPVDLARLVEEHGGRPACAGANSGLATAAPENGDYTAFWADRDYLRGAANVRASVFAVHGLGDDNVKPINVGRWWDALARAGVPRRLWLSQTGHVDPFDYRRGQWVATLHRWFDHWLLGVANGVEREPQASVERRPDAWVDEPVWPPVGTHAVTLHPEPGATPGLGVLGTAPAAPGTTEAFTDAAGQDARAWAAAPGKPSAARVLFDTGPLAHDLRLAGTGSVTLTVTPATPTAHLAAVLVDYGPATVRDDTAPGEGIRTLGTRSCWGASRPGDSACYLDTAAVTADVDRQVFARGWADLGHHDSPARGEPLTPGRAYPMTFRLSTTDHVVPAGHHLVLIVGGTDSGTTVPPSRPGRLRLDLAGSLVRLPVVVGPRPGGRGLS